MSDNQNDKGDEQSTSSTTDSEENRPILSLEALGRQKKRSRKTCLNFGKVFEIFPGKDTKVLCQLAELSELLPSRVRALVPEASAVQITAFMNLVEDTRRQRKRRRRGASGSYEGRVRPRSREPVSPVESDKERVAGSNQVTPEPENLPDEKSEFMGRLKKLIHAEEGNRRDSGKFSDKFETTILNLLEAVQPKEYNADHFEQVYNKLLNDPVARAQLGNLHAARAFKYGYAQYGPKF